jgi:hypothetical protein
MSRRPEMTEYLPAEKPDTLLTFNESVLSDFTVEITTSFKLEFNSIK